MQTRVDTHALARGLLVLGFMQTIDPDQLAHITGGLARANPDKLDRTLELALTQLESDIKTLAQPQPNNQLTTLMMVAMMSRR